MSDRRSPERGGRPLPEMRPNTNRPGMQSNGDDNPWRIGAGVGMTYDPAALTKWRLRASQGDPAAVDLLTKVDFKPNDTEQSWAQRRGLDRYDLRSDQQGRGPWAGGERPAMYDAGQQRGPGRPIPGVDPVTGQPNQGGGDQYGPQNRVTAPSGTDWRGATDRLFGRSDGRMHPDSWGSLYPDAGGGYGPQNRNTAPSDVNWQGAGMFGQQNGGHGGYQPPAVTDVSAPWRGDNFGQPDNYGQPAVYQPPAGYYVGDPPPGQAPPEGFAPDPRWMQGSPPGGVADLAPGQSNATIPGQPPPVEDQIQDPRGPRVSIGGPKNYW